MSIVLFVMKDCFFVFNFKLQEYIPMDKDKNLKRPLVISYLMFEL
jgi:hypothetical protein